MVRPPRQPATKTAQPWAFLTLGLACFTLAWALAILLVDALRFVVYAPTARAGFEVILASASLFAGLVLALFPTTTGRPRLEWVAAGFVVLGAGGLLFGYLVPLLDATPDLNGSMYAVLATRALGEALFVVGLVPRQPPRLTARLMLGAGTLFILLAALVLAVPDQLPTLVAIDDLQVAAAAGGDVLPGLTAWHWALSAIPLGLTVVALLAALGRLESREVSAWLALALGIRVGAQFHGMFWPSAYSQIITTSSILRLAFTTTIVVGGVLELRRIARERAASLEAERAAARQMAEAMRLRSDFARIVVHELSSPLAAVIRYTEILDAEALTPTQQYALGGIRTQATMLRALFTDIATVGVIGRDDFAVDPRPVSVNEIIEPALSYARAMAGNGRLQVAQDYDGQVRADPARIAQVLRNLLSNALKYSPDGSPVVLRVTGGGDHVQFAVEDRGAGIDPAEVPRLLEKFERGSDHVSQNAGGTGVGLYLSRKLLQAHRANLQIDSTPGVGSSFSFVLDVAR